jgi:thiol-disulfide isomerase/thioredoxin
MRLSDSRTIENMMHTRLRTLLIGASLASIPLSGAVAAAPRARAHVEPAPPAIVVTPAGAAAIKNAIAARKGHVVVVNFWATWCDPCVAEFPDLVKFASDYRGRGVVVFAVSADSRKDVDSKVKPFLAQKRAAFPQFLQQSTDPEDFINAFDPKWQGDLPRTFVYDRKGVLVKELAGAHGERDFAAAVEPLLKQPRGSESVLTKTKID